MEPGSFTKLARRYQSGEDVVADALARRILSQFGSGAMRAADRRLFRDTRARVDPEDVFQSAVMGLLRSLREGTAVACRQDVKRLLHAIVANTARQENRDQHRQIRDPRRERTLPEDASGHPPAPRDDPQPESPCEELAALIRKAADDLPPRLLPLLRLLMKDCVAGVDRTDAERAKELGESPSTVSRKREALSRELRRRSGD